MASIRRRPPAGNRSKPDERQHHATVAEALHGAVDTTKEAAAKLVQSLTISWHEIEDWQRDNEHIHEGYRRAQNTFRGCLQSVFGYLHNETVNIHSHLIGAILFLALSVIFYTYKLPRYATAGWADLGVFIVFLSAAVFCMACSAFYHTCTCHSERVSNRCQAFDYTGIVVLIVGSFFPCIYYAFYCQPGWQRVYLAVIFLAGLGAASIVLNPEYGKPTHRGARTKVFVGLGLSGIVPVTHALLVHGFSNLVHDMGFGYLLLSGALYLVGALIYANRFPERLYRGKFDIFGASHQIFHLHVVAAAAAHYACILKAFEYRHGGGAGCPSS